MLKRRILKENQKVIIIHDKQLGYVKQHARFVKYKNQEISKGLFHDVPHFEYDGKSISGLNCFWILPDDIKSDKDIEVLQKE